jgi:hypothetical protein
MDDGAYRCSTCGHGRTLYACAHAMVSGRLAEDGNRLVSEDWVEQTAIIHSSIQCEQHADAVMQRKQGGRWVSVGDPGTPSVTLTRST